MKYALSLILIATALLCKGQNSHEDEKFINSVVDIGLFKTPGFYVDRFPADEIERMKGVLNKDTIYSNNWNWRVRTYFIFSKPEREFITAELER